MVKYKVLEKGVRLDVIVHSHYGDLTMFDIVVQANSQLQAILSVGDIVNLPLRKVASVSEDKLW